MKVHLFLRKAVEFRAKVVGFYFEQVGLCIVVSAFDFQCFGFLPRKENLKKRRKGVAPRKWIEVQSVEGYKVEQCTMSAVARRKVARRAPEEGERRGKSRAE